MRSKLLVRSSLRLPLSSLLLLVLLFAAVAPALRAQTRTFEGSASVTEVEVPVNVTTRDGEPVRGLTADDFELLDEGRPQTLSGFRVVDLTLSPPAAEGQTGGAAGAEELPAIARRHFLFLFDLSFADPNAVLKARIAARDFILKSLRPDDLAAVATFSLETGPRLVMTFTPDRSQLALAITTLGYNQLAQDRRAIDPLRFLLEPPADAVRDLGPTTETAERNLSDVNKEAIAQTVAVLNTLFERQQKSYDRSRIVAWSRAMGELARALDSVQGRKQVIYFSEGFDSRLLLGRRPDAADEAAEDQLNIARGDYFMVDTDNFYGNPSLQRYLGEMLEQFRRADCVIQAVDIGGLRADADIRERPRDVGQDGLFYLANETGGVLFKDANNLTRELPKVLERSEVTYVLSFGPDRLKEDGAYHHLTVKLKKDMPRGTSVSNRSGYYAPRPFQDLDPLEKTLLASDAIASAAPRQEVGLHVLAAAFRATPTSAYVPVIAEIDGRTLLAGQTDDQLSVELYTYVTDAQGVVRDFFTQKIGLDVSKGRESMVKTGLKYYGHLELGPGKYLARVLVRNAGTGHTGVESVSVEVPPYDQAAPVLLPPFFVEPPGRWFMVRETATEGRGASIVYPFTVKGEPYIPAARPMLAGDAEAELCLVGYNLGAGDLKLDAKVMGKDGQVLSGGRLALRERTVTGLEGVDKLLATFEPTGLKAGDYTLEVEVTEPATGHNQVSSIPFTVMN